MRTYKKIVSVESDYRGRVPDKMPARVKVGDIVECWDGWTGIVYEVKTESYYPICAKTEIDGTPDYREFTEMGRFVKRTFNGQPENIKNVTRTYYRK